MAQGRSFLLRLTGDPDDAKRAIREVTDRLVDLGRQKAEATISVATGRAREELRRVDADLKRIDGQQVNARINLQTAALNVQLDAARARLERLSQQEVTPKVTLAMGRAIEQIDRLEVKLAALERKRVNIDIDVGRGIGERALAGIGTAFDALGQAAGGAIGGIQNFASVIASLGPFLTGAAIIIGTLLAPALLLLGASLANAVIGAGALAAALAGLAGPVVLVAIAALARFAAILQAVKEHQTQASQQSSAVAGAQDQIRSATDALAQAQDNLRTQTTAAYQAWQDAIEAVKDDLLSVEHAELGIEGANLRLRQAQQALRNFRAEAGAAGASFDSLFRRFSDVDFHGDISGITRALQAAGGPALSGDDSLRLQQLLHDVKEAKLGEKDASDALHDSNVKLSRDRRTEADFAQRGIAAFAGYRSAVQGVASAQRSLVTAQRQSNTALEHQGRLWDQLSGPERRFAKRLENFEDAFKRAFGPATSRILGGFGRALDTIGEALNKKGVRDSLTRIGAAIGLMVSSIANTLTSKEFLSAFQEFANTAARLIRSFGSTAARDFLRLFLRIAKEALPPLVDGVGKLVSGFDHFLGRMSQAQSRTRGFGAADTLSTSSPLQRFIDHAVDSFKTWIDTIKQLGRILGGFFKAMLPDGDKLAGSFHDIVKNFADWVNSRKGQQSIRSFFSDVRADVEGIARNLERAGRAISAIDKATKLGPLAPLFSIFGRGHAGDLVPGHAEGGLIPGRGHGDTVPAWLTPGEFVIRRRIVDQLGAPFFAALNGGMAFAAGGAVPAAASGRAGTSIGVVELHQHVPGGQAPDELTAATRMVSALQRLGRG